MPQIGDFPGGKVSRASKRAIIRTAKSPLDRCTVVSIYPRDIDEEKPTIFPGKFSIRAGSFEKPSILVVGTSSWYKDFSLDQPIIEIPSSSVEVSEALIKDYCSGLLGCDMEGAMPGLFYTHGEHTVEQIQENFKSKLAEVKQKQDNWFTVLVRIADSLWSTSNGNPRVIWDIMRIAAMKMNLDKKPWLQDMQLIEKVKCMFCGQLKDPAFPVCPNCHIADPNHPLSKEIVKAHDPFQMRPQPQVNQ